MTAISEPVDLAAFKRRQKAMWASGDFGVIASLIQPVAERLADSANLDAGSRVLDVAGGTGNAAIAAARCGCRVTCVDYVPRLLERGRARGPRGSTSRSARATPRRCPAATASTTRCCRSSARCSRPTSRAPRPSWCAPAGRAA
jgi:SAM-dependent methyltransferase